MGRVRQKGEKAGDEIRVGERVRRESDGREGEEEGAESKRRELVGERK